LIGKAFRHLIHDHGTPEPVALVTFGSGPFADGAELALTDQRLPDEAGRSSQEHGRIGLLDKLPVFPGVGR
jgi:hypothetical protein